MASQSSKVTSDTNVLIFGTGSVGACYAYILKQAGANVTAVCRSNYQVAKEQGFTINSAKWGSVHVKPNVVRTVDQASSISWDYILVCSKAYPGSKPSTSELIAPAVTERTAIVLVQNGIGIEDEYAAAFPDNTIISAVVYLPVTQTSPGIIKMGDLEFIQIGTFPSAASDAHKIATQYLHDLIQAGKGTVEMYDDIQPLRWKKLIVNAPWNPICALARCNDAALMLASPYAKDMVFKCMLEVVDVANACGYDQLTEVDVRAQLARATARIPDKGIEPSMLADIWEDRAMEVEAIVGNMIRMAEEKKVAVPFMTMVYALVKGLDESNAARRKTASSAVKA